MKRDGLWSLVLPRTQGVLGDLGIEWCGSLEKAPKWTGDSNTKVNPSITFT